ncbi:CAP domain-containing protein [Bombilactobacillus bombi]|uniref:CAP domain-containing protein n=1 Tax=Bombilactobacillus bombi TaxID=1303590 RepID=UPI0015E5FEC7|nr:CAP domain-containing protein [Bombilactobacillus bombi]MBA1434294.1 CAP domain-containing protein [Bombilactobacillus bombi]
MKTHKILHGITGVSLLMAIGLMTNVRSAKANANDFNYNVATVSKLPAAHLYTDDGVFKVSRLLVAKSDWRVGQVKIMNGHYFYQVSSHEWLRDDDSYTNFSPQNVNNEGQLLGTIISKAPVIFNNSSRSYLKDNTRFPEKSVWKVSNVVKNKHGEYFFRISTNEYISDQYMRSSRPLQNSDVKYIADFGIVDNSDSNKPNNVTPVNNNDPETISESIYSAINTERSQRGLAPLHHHAGLMNAAATRAQEQAKIFGSVRPNGQDWTTILTQQIYPHTQNNYNEIVNYIPDQNSTLEQIVALNMLKFHNFSSQYATLINPDFTDIGIGVYLNKTANRYYVVEIFANPGK